MAECTFCGERVSYKTVIHDKRKRHPKMGAIHEGQDVIHCLSCERSMHTACVVEHGTTLPGSHVQFASKAMRGYVADKKMEGEDLAFCLRCYDDVTGQIVNAYRDSGEDDKASSFLKELEQIRVKRETL